MNPFQPTKKLINLKIFKLVGFNAKKIKNMKTFEQIINEIKKEEPKEKVKQILKKEYETCLKYVEEDSERLESSIKRVINGDSDHISIYAIYAQHREIELSNHIAKLYEDLFGEKID